MDIQKLIVPIFPSSLFNFPNRLQKILKVSAKDGEKTTMGSAIRNYDEREVFETNLEKQLLAWKESPKWTDEPPEIKVNVPKGSLCQVTVKANIGSPPDAVYNIFTDPDNKRVFKNIKEVISRKVLFDDGSRQVVEVEQAALWKFLWWSGTISVHVLVDQNRKDHSMQFKQMKAGFMKKFEGRWRVEPLLVDAESCSLVNPSLKDYHKRTKGKGRIGSKVCLEQLVQPAIVPPPPISWYLRGITSKTAEMLMNDLIAEAARIRGTCEAFNGGSKTSPRVMSDESKVDDLGDIKARWALRRRRNKKQSRKRLAFHTTSSNIL